MIEDLDASLKALLAGEATPGSLLAGANISFAAPDAKWQGQGSGMQINIYLYRILDNRELRSNQRNVVMNPDGSVTTQMFPSRLECSYIITAWDMGSDVAGIDKEPSEHALLGQILYILWRNPTFPTQYLIGVLLNAELALPVFAAESEDMAAKPDFWSALDTYVRPAITCRVTVEIDLNQDLSGPQTTAIVATLGQGAGPPGPSASTDQFVDIGGFIRNALTPEETVADAWVLLDSSLVTAISDATGGYILSGIAPGPHTLTVRAEGFAQAISTITIPSSSGFYDVNLTPL